MSTIVNDNPDPLRSDTAADLLLELRSVSKSFGAVAAVRDVSMTIRNHEVVGLIGENGAGKSTLLRMLAGVHQPDAGAIDVAGEPREFRRPRDAARAGISVVHQEQSLLANLTVAENIVYGSEALGERFTRFGMLRWSAINTRAGEALRRVGSDIEPTAVVNRLSFAQRQMVEIARAVDVALHCGARPIVVLDEPTSLLEGAEIEAFEQEVARLRRLGSVVFVSHRLGEILRVCDRVYVLRNGEVVAERLTSSVQEDDLFELMTERKTGGTTTRIAQNFSPTTVLKASGCTRNGHFQDVSLQVRAGEIVAMVGANGSGREQFSRSLFGIEALDSGWIEIAGRRLRNPNVRRAVAAGVAYLPAERRVEAMFPGLSVAESLTLTHPGSVSTAGMLNRRRMRSQAEGWIRRLDIRPPQPQSDAARLSGGNQQKVVLGRWLMATDLKLLILDHPLRGLDPGAQEQVRDLLLAQARERGVAILLLADTLEEALELGDTIVVMRDGKVTSRVDCAQGKPSLVDLMERMV